MTDDNVTPFRPKQTDEIIFHCDCGTISFFLHSDGCIECTNCKTRHYDTGGEWIKRLPDVPSETPEKTDSGKITSTFFGSANLAKQRVLKHIVELSNRNQLSVLIGYDNEGAGKIWTNISTVEQKEWVIEKITAVLEHMKYTKVT